MDDFKLMAILNTTNNLVKNFTSLVFIHALLFYNVVKELTFA